MKNFKTFLDKKHKKNSLIICAGSSINNEFYKIEKFIKNNIDDLDIFAINNILPELKKYVNYHIFTNTQRFRTYGNKIDFQNHEVLLGKNININLKNKIVKNNDYYNIDYTDKEGIPLGYKNGKINGFFRTAGCLTIFISHLMKHKNISVVGHDGYTLYNYNELESKENSQHWYGEGFTDTATYKTCSYKDKLIYNVLDNLKDYGVNFKILTKTLYSNHYDPSILEG